MRPFQSRRNPYSLPLKIMNNVHSQHWYREPWPWLLMAGPFAVVLASGFTFWLAFVHSDPLVVDDYYKAGKTINRTLRRDSNAQALGLSGAMTRDNNHITITVDHATRVVLPQTLNLLLIHTTQREKDRVVRLSTSRPGVYSATIGNILPGHYHVTLEDSEETWRLTGDWRAGDGHAKIALQVKK
jgi:uncharacterized protein